MEAVATAAGVSRQTVYDRFENKPSLLRAMVTRSEEEAGLPTRLQSVFAETDGLKMLRAFLDTIAAVEPKVYPYSRLVYAARMEDPTAAELWRWRLSSRHRGMGAVIARLAVEGRLRAGINAEEATDLAWAFTSPHQYEYLVVERRWSIARYRAHLERTINERLLQPAHRRRVGAGSRR